MTKTEEMKRLEADMASDKELYEMFNKTVDRIAGEKTVQSDGELFAKAAQELGYNITAADFEKLDAEKEEVSADELKQVAGGNTDHGYDHDYDYDSNECQGVYDCNHTAQYTKDEHGHDTWCLTAWHCLTATVHTQSESKDVACWKNYDCMWINK